MSKKIVLTPSIQRILQRMGEHIKLARLRRNIPMKIVAERSSLGRTTVWAIEKGSPSVSMGPMPKSCMPLMEWTRTCC